MELEEVYRAYSVRVYRFLRSRLSSDADAEDLTGQVFERVMGGLARFDERKGTLETWVFAIARNALRDHLRRAAIRRWVGLDAAAEVVATDIGPEQSALDAERFADLRRALDRLNARECTIVSLRYFAGLRNVDIARLMRLSEKNVGVILSRALKKLRAELKEGEA